MSQNTACSSLRQTFYGEGQVRGRNSGPQLGQRRGWRWRSLLKILFEGTQSSIFLMQIYQRRANTGNHKLLWKLLGGQKRKRKTKKREPSQQKKSQLQRKARPPRTPRIRPWPGQRAMQAMRAMPAMSARWSGHTRWSERTRWSGRTR